MPSATKVQTGYLEAVNPFALSSGTASAPTLTFTNSSATGMFSPSTGALAFSTGSTQNALTILSTGNVGIASTNPTERLDVAGNIKLSGQIHGPSTLIIDPSTVGDDTGTVSIKGNLEVLGTTTTINSTILSIDDKNIVLADGVSTLTNLDTAGIDFGSTSVRVRYNFNGGTNSGLSVEGTSVGIGTTIPLALTHIFKSRVTGFTPLTGYDQLIIENNDSGTNGTVLQLVSNATSGVCEIGFSDSTRNQGLISYNHSLDRMAIRVNGSEQIVINSSGNVGIGSTIPSYKLDVQGGTANIESRLKSASGNNLILSTTDASNKMQLLFSNDTNLFWRIQSVEQSVNYRALVLQNDGGNVGIGTTNPASKLHVYSTVDDDGIDIALAKTPIGGEGPSIVFRHSTNNGTQRDFAKIKSKMSNGNDASWGSTLSFFTGGNSLTEQLTILSSGFVGINTTSPGNRLHVNGEVKVGPEFFVNNGVYGVVGNRILVGTDTLPYSLQDTNQRPTIYLSGKYPEITLNHTVTDNNRHGPTLKFVHNGTGSQFVIGTNGTGTQLDIGYGSNTDWNAHNGIDNYLGTTRFRLAASGIQVGSISGTAEGSLDVVGSHINGTQAASWSGYTLGDTYCDLTISRRHSATNDAVLGYAAASMDFRASNSADEWSVGQIIGVVDPLNDGGHKGGLAFAVATGGQTNATGRRTKGYATIRAVLNGTQMRMVQDTRTVYGPNTTWGAYLSVGGNGDQSGAGVASMSTTNGNLHLDAADGGFGVYLNWYGGTTGVWFGNGSTGQVARLDGVGNFTANGTKSFKIPHPLPEKTETHDLIHVSVESPQAENIYSGMIELINGVATVNLDEVSGMTEGTFVLLNTKLRRFVTNESGWTPVKSNISGNILTIEAQDPTCEDECFWMVIGQRSDIHMIDSDMTDASGNMIVEPLKEVYNSSQVNENILNPTIS